MERTKYMQQIMNETYAGVAIEAIQGGFTGAWERLLIKRLRKDQDAGLSEAECLIDMAGGISDQKLMEVAKAILNSKIHEHATN